MQAGVQMYAEGRILAEAEGVIGWLTFNQPERLNAVRRDMWDAIPAAVAALVANPAVRCIVVRGAGERAFISGADIAEFDVQRNDAATNREFTASVSAATASLLSARVPVIAMINGFCIGGGIVIATACDIRICSEGSLFGVPAGRLGLGYELDNLQRLQAIVGRGMALEMIATARQLASGEALRVGLVTHVVPEPSLNETVRAMAKQIATTAPKTFAAAKLASGAGDNPHLRAVAQAAIDACFDSEDFREGRAAFHARRNPVFKGQ